MGALKVLRGRWGWDSELARRMRLPRYLHKATSSQVQPAPSLKSTIRNTKTHTHTHTHPILQLLRHNLFCLADDPDQRTSQGVVLGLND